MYNNFNTMKVMKASFNFMKYTCLFLMLIGISVNAWGAYTKAEGTFVKVTNAASLAAGDEIIIVASEYNCALSATQNTNNRGESNVVKNDNKITLTAENNVQLITLSVKNNHFEFNTGEGYLYAASSTDNYLRTQATNNANGEWTISISEGVAAITAQGTNTRNVLQYNSSSSLFSCYASASQAGVSVYRKRTADPTTIILSEAGVESIVPGTYYANDIYTLPTTTASTCGDKVLVGWSTVAIPTEGAKPTSNFFEKGEEVNLGATNKFYAVFADENEGDPEETKTQTLQYDTWTYSGSTTDKSSYRLFHSGSYIESAEFDLSKLSKVIVYGGTFGGDSYNSLTIGDGTNTWKSVTVSGKSETGTNTYTDGTSLSGTKELRITSNSGSSSGSGSGVRISKVEIFTMEPTVSYSNYTTTCSSGVIYTDYITDCSPVYPVRYACATTGDVSEYALEGAPIQIIADPEEEGYEFRGWTVTTDGGDDVTVNGTSNHYSFTMPADGVTISCNMVAVYTATWSSASGDPQVVSYPADQAVVPATPTECSTKTFMGWSTAPITELQQSAPAMIDFTTPVSLSCNTTYYAVYASKNGGKVTAEPSVTISEDFNNVTGSGGYKDSYDWTTSGLDWHSHNIQISTNAKFDDGNGAMYYYNSSRTFAYFGPVTRIQDVEKVTFSACYAKQGAQLKIRYKAGPTDSWTYSDAFALSTKMSAQEYTFTQPGDYYVQFYYTSSTEGTYIYLDNIQFYTGHRSFWYSDYSTTCDQTANPTMSFANGGGTGSVDAITTPGWITLPEGSALTKNCDIFAGWQVTGVADYTQTFQPGDKYLLNYNVTMTAQWTSHPCATGSLDATAAYITTTTGVAKKSVLYTLTITSIDGETVTPHITGTDAALFAVTDAVLDLASATKTYKFRVQYTPTSAGVKNTNAALTFTDAAGKPITDGSGNTLTMTLNGRSVADEIVLAAKVGDVWYSLPANMDMANTHIGLPITVDNAANPTTATTVSADAIYTLNALHNSSTSDVSRVRFASTLDSKALWGSASNNSIKNWATLTGDAKGDAYDWILTTSDLNSYTITNNRGSSTARNLSINNNHYWGLHGELIASADIRILAKGTVITYIPMTVTNWLDAGYTFTTSVEIPSYSSILVLYGGSEFTATMTGSGPYTFNIPGVDYDNHSGEALTVEWLDAGGTPVAMGVVNTPIFIKTTTGTLTDYDPEFLATTDVHVLNGGKLTVAANCTIKNLIVGGGGTVVHTAGTFSVYALSLEGGLDVANGTEYDMPRLYITSPAVFKSTQSTVNFDVTVDKRNYYPFSVPFEVEVSSINYVDPVLRAAAVYNKHFAIKTYDGDNRAKNGEDKNANWRLVQTTETLKPGVGYILTAVSVANYDSRIRIPMTIVNDWTANGELSTYDAVTRNAVEVTAYTGAAATSHQHHAGWNFVANPYLAAFAGSNIAGDQEYIKGKVIITGESSDPYGYDDTEVTYVSIPTYDFSEYVQTPMSTAVLAPEWGFFVQIGTSGTMTFANAGRQQVAPRYLMAETETPRKLETALVLTDKTDKSDRTGLIVSNRYSAAYEIGADLEKMFGSGYTLATYTIVGGTRLAYNAMSEAEAHQLIPVGYRAPEAGTYTFSLDVTDEMAAYFERLDLIDYETGELTNLLTNTYTFTTERTQSDSRFAINATIRKVPTGLDDGVPEVDDGVQKVIWHEHFYIIDHNRVYDGTGSLVNIKK